MVDLMEAYDGVVSSSTDIIKNKQRHLYINMFDLLRTTTKAAAASTNFTISENICKFWYSDILPICFDDDSNIQNSAIDSIDIFVNNIDSTQFRNSSKWPQLKQQIVENYIEKLNKMRDEPNSNWYKIWILLIRILNQEIVRSASIINTFLSVVEHGFRSSNYEIRAEAFICWKVLVEIFAVNNELISPKRIKLISIPLRSSHSKTESAAVNKFKVWWYFLLQLNDNIYNNCEMVFEAFLQFCFGNNKAGNNNSSSGTGQLRNFNYAKEMAVIGLIEMLGSSHKEIHLLLEKYELEHTEETLITESIMQKSYKSIIKACFEATLIIIEQFTNRIKLIELLWRNLISQIIQTKNATIYKECCIIIKTLIQTDYDNPDINIKTDILQICNIFGTHYAFLMTTYNDNDASFDINRIAETIIDFTDILLSGGILYFNIDNYKPIIKNIYDIDEYKESSKYWDMLKNLIENLLNSDKIDNFNNFEIKLEIWKRLSLPIITYLDIKLFEFRLFKKAELINNWLLWPLNKIVLTNLSFYCIKNDLKLYDDDFFNIWKKLIISSANAEGRSNFQTAVFSKFVNFVEKREILPKYQDILGYYIKCWEKKIDLTSAPKDQLDLIQQLLIKSPGKKENYNKIIDYLIEYFASLDELKIVIIFNKIINLSKQIIQSEKLNYITKSCCDNYKKKIIEKFKSDKMDKKYLKTFVNLFKNNDTFTIIPKVWTLNPDKLTEHQVEKMKEKKCDIPALYNDNSYSEDGSNSIKPWTPNKIVISKDKNLEKIVLPGRSEIIINSPKESKTSLISEDFKAPEPVDSLIKAYCEISDTYDSSSTTKTENSLPKMIGKNIVINNKSKKMQTKKINNTSMKKNTKKEEELLKTMNINVDDEKKKNSILRKLKSISIDTVEGNTFYKSFNSRRNLLSNDNEPGILTRRAEKDKNKLKTSQIDTNLNKSKNKHFKAARKSLNFKDNRQSFNLVSNEESVSNKSNLSLNNFDEDIVVSSQISESLLSRRGRRSLSSLSNEPSKITTVTERTEVTDNIQENIDNVVKESVTVCEETLPNKNLPIILGNELIKMSEIDTQLNTENVSIIDLNANKKHSPILTVLKSLQNNQLLTYTKEQPQKNPIVEINTPISHNANEKSSSNSSLANNVAHELFISQSTINSPITKKSPQSESVKELKSLLNRHNNSPIVKEKPNQLNLNDTSPNNIKNMEIRQTTPPTTPKQNVKKTCEYETEPNSNELIANSICVNEKQITVEKEMPVTPKHRKINMQIIEETIIKSPAYSPIKQIKKSIKSKGNNSTVASPEFDDVNKRNNENEVNKSSKSKVLDRRNSSIVTSPECTNVNKRNAEFFNDTLNISPIQITPYKCNAEKDISGEEMEIGDDFVKTKDFTDYIEKQQLSPTRKINKPSSALASPPDRKSTANNSSPGPKPKQPSQSLTGRGAQLINMIRNRKVTSPAKRIANIFSNSPKSISETVTIGGQHQNHQLQNNQNNIQSPLKENDTGVVQSSPIPASPKQVKRDLLVFSKILPSPYASPSASILKRKCCVDNVDDFDSPAIKRKRVSFHDPPVSVTKEYVKNYDEENAKMSVRMALNKFLQSSTPTNQQNISSNQQPQQQQPQQQQIQNSNKHVLKRKSRADSMMELLRFNESPIQNQQKKLQSKSTIQSPHLQEIELNTEDELKDSSNIQQHTSAQIDPITWNATNEISTNEIPINQSNEKILSSVLQDDYEPSLTPSPQIYFPDDAAIFKHIFEKYTIDNIFEKYCENGYELNNKNLHNIIKQISIKMETDNKIKTNILETLSEKHPKEFLDHAIQENLSSVVCDRLNASSVVDFVFDKSKINTGVRKIVYEKMENIISTDRFINERHDIFMTMLRNQKLTNDEILECIEIISSKRMRNIINNRGDATVVSTSETVDSSSSI